MIKGINQNTHPERTPAQYIYWAKNAILNNELDAAINEKGNLQEVDLVPYNIDYIIGSTTLNYYLILFYKSLNAEDCIAVINGFTNTVSIKVLRTDLGFDINFPIRAKAKFNPDNQIVVAFIQDNQVPKYINLDTASITDSLNFYNLFPITSSPSRIDTSVIDGGSVIAGTHYFTFAYISKDRTRSTYTTVSDPVYVTLVDGAQVYTQTNGNKSGVSTNKSIRLTFYDVDTTYDKISLAIISRVQGIVSQKIIKEVPISSSTLTVLYNGTEFLGDITLDELVSDNIRYTSAKHITILEDQIYLGDLTTGTIFDYQLLINQSVIQYLSTYDTQNPVAGISKYKTGVSKTMLHDEVNAIYMQVELNDGTFTDWYHVPGRAPVGGETSNSGLSTGGLTITGRTPKVYEIEDTSSPIGSIVNTNGVLTISGNMGFWQNDNEVYPNSARWGSLAGQKVRHHKFPSIEKMATVYSGQSEYGISNLDKLSIQVVNAALFTRPEVKGYRLGYAKRTLADVGVVGMGLTTFAGIPQKGGGSVTDPLTGLTFDPNTLQSSGGNFRIACLNGTDDDLYVNRGYLRFNSFDIWQDRPSLVGTYLRNYIKLKANKLAKNASGYAGDNTYGQVYIGTINVQTSTFMSNFTKAGTNNTVKSTVTSNDKVRKLENQFYIPNHSTIVKGSITYVNAGQEEIVSAQIDGADLDIALYGKYTTKTNGLAQGDIDPNLAEETYLAAIKNPRSDYFLGFENQTIITSNTLFRNSGNNINPDTFNEGFLGVHSYISLALYNIHTDQLTNEGERIVNFKAHLAVSRHNVGLRYQNLGDYSTYFYSDMGLFNLVSSTSSLGGVITENGPIASNPYWFMTYSKKLPWNQFQYSKDYSALQDLETFSIFTENVSGRSTYPYRIARSTKASRDNSLEDGWKTFKAADFFDTVANKGAITNLEAWGTDTLLIHHRNALFRTRDKAVLQADTISISLGSGDIFAIEPKEESPTNEGVGGTQHSFACKLTDAGYIYPDAETGKMYIYNGAELKEIGMGLRLFFRKYLSCSNNNPYLKSGTDKGIVIAYDQVNNRILLSQRAANSFTVSFSLEKYEWSSAHDYIPDFMLNTRAKLYMFKDNKLYTSGIGNRGNFFGQVYPFYVDFIINENPTEEKVMEYIKFLCKVKDTSGNVLQRKTVTQITMWNDQFCTGVMDVLTNETESLFIDSNIKVYDQAWYFNEVNDQVDDPDQPFIDTLLNDSRPIQSNLKTPLWYDTEVIRGKYFIIRLEYSNIENKEVHLRELIPSYQKSY